MVLAIIPTTVGRCQRRPAEYRRRWQVMPAMYSRMIRRCCCNKTALPKGEQLGSSVALADMNNDGVVDLLVGSPLANVTPSGTVLKKAGQIQIISGKDNSVLRTISGSALISNWVRRLPSCLTRTKMACRILSWVIRWRMSRR